MYFNKLIFWRFSNVKKVLSTYRETAAVYRGARTETTFFSQNHYLTLVHLTEEGLHGKDYKWKGKQKYYMKQRQPRWNI